MILDVLAVAYGDKPLPDVVEMILPLLVGEYFRFAPDLSIELLSEADFLTVGDQD
jgi:hypothetical protein